MTDEKGLTKSRKRIRSVLAALAAFVLFVLVFAVSFDWWVMSTTADRNFEDIRTIPENDIGIVFGTSRWVATGRENLYFTTRMEAAAQLYHHGKIKHLLLTGDNRTSTYNEPVTMKTALLKLGVPDSSMTLDYAGFRTLDSIVRAVKVFEVKRATIISQEFHNPRALFIADYYGLKAIAYVARPVRTSTSAYIDLRERLARFLAVVDLYILNKQPKFLGDPEPIYVSRSVSSSS